jgi:hypothetical protein
MRRVGLTVLACGLLAAATPAHAYVRYTTDDGMTGLYWQVTCVPVYIYLNGFTQMRPDEVAKAVAAAAHTWSPDEVTCADGTSHPYLEIVPTLSTGGAVPTVKYDAHNSLIIQTANWTHAVDALALTSVFHKPNGRIVDADIEVNATNLTWVNYDPGTQVDLGHDTQPYDMQNALTHEFGHFIGLDHTCYTPSVDPTMTAPRPNDNLGNPVPDCDVAPDAIRATVMFPSIASGFVEVTKRTLSSDDIQAVCDIYPTSLDPQVCAMDSPNDGLGCNAAPVARAAAPARPTGLGAALAAAALCLGWAGTRRSRRR